MAHLVYPTTPAVRVKNRQLLDQENRGRVMRARKSAIAAVGKDSGGRNLAGYKWEERQHAADTARTRELLFDLIEQNTRA